MADRPLTDLVARLERERLEADRRYHEALAALDAAVRALPAGADSLPGAAHDASQLARANERFEALAGALDAGRAAAGGGAVTIRGRLRALVWSLVSPPLAAQQELNAALLDHLNRNVAAHDAVAASVRALGETLAADRAASSRVHTELVRYLQTITEYVDAKDRALAGPELREQIVLVSERAMATARALDGLRAQGSASTGQSSRSDRPTTNHQEPTTDFSYVGFEDRFRGSEEEIRSRVKDYVPLFANRPTDQPANLPVLDVGCGRGELLALLKESGVAARGIDLNGEMVALCRERGFEAERADALSYLESQPDASLGGLTAIQVVEHLEPAYLARFLETAFHKLAPGAPIALETINPGCWMAFFEAYLRDLTHAQPIHADVLRFLVQTAGFSSVDIQYRSPVTDADRLHRVNGPGAGAPPALLETIAALNANADKLNARLFGFMDYAVVGRR